MFLLYLVTISAHIIKSDVDWFSRLNEKYISQLMHEDFQSVLVRYIKFAGSS